MIWTSFRGHYSAPHLMKISFRIEGKIKTISIKENQRESVTSRLNLNELLKGVLLEKLLEHHKRRKNTVSKIMDQYNRLEFSEICLPVETKLYPLLFGINSS